MSKWSNFDVTYDVSRKGNSTMESKEQDRNEQIGGAAGLGAGILTGMRSGLS